MSAGDRHYIILADIISNNNSSLLLSDNFLQFKMILSILKKKFFKDARLKLWITEEKLTSYRTNMIKCIKFVIKLTRLLFEHKIFLSKSIGMSWICNAGLGKNGINLVKSSNIKCLLHHTVFIGPWKYDDVSAHIWLGIRQYMSIRLRHILTRKYQT